MLRIVWLLVVLGAVGAASPVNSSAPAIVSVVPNPVAPNDHGEYVVVMFPNQTDLSNISLTDEESTVHLPNRTVSGPIAITTHPAMVSNRTTIPVVPVSGWMKLANSGETIQLLSEHRVIDSVTYTSAPEGQRYHLTATGWEWQPLGATAYSVPYFHGSRARAFVLPDAPTEPVTALNSARDRILLGGYSFTSHRVTKTLCTVRHRGVSVDVLVDDSPVGGMPETEARLLDQLVTCGVNVTVIGGQAARYTFHHAKYAVIDDRALVLTENWKPAGTGGQSSRGWGVLVDDPRVAATVADVFESDTEWRDSIPWQQFKQDADLSTGLPPVTGEYPSTFEPETVPVEKVAVIVAPDNAEDAIVEVLDDANETILVEQVSVGNPDHPFVQAVLRAARRGVTVKILISSAWFVRDANQAWATEMNAIAKNEGIPLEVRLAEPRGQFEKIHAKGVVIDGQTVVLGSINWNAHSTRENRELALILIGDDIGDYYSQVILADWRQGRWQLPAGFASVVTISGVLSGIGLLRLIQFADTPRPAAG